MHFIPVAKKLQPLYHDENGRTGGGLPFGPLSSTSLPSLTPSNGRMSGLFLSKPPVMRSRKRCQQRPRLPYAEVMHRLLETTRAPSLTVLTFGYP